MQDPEWNVRAWMHMSIHYCEHVQAQLTHIINVGRISTPGQQHLTNREISFLSRNHQWCFLELSIGWSKKINSSYKTYSHTILHIQVVLYSEYSRSWTATLTLVLMLTSALASNNISTTLK